MQRLDYPPVHQDALPKITKEKMGDHNFLYPSDSQHKNVSENRRSFSKRFLDGDIPNILLPFADVTFVNTQRILWIGLRYNLGFLERESRVPT